MTSVVDLFKIRSPYFAKDVPVEELIKHYSKSIAALPAVVNENVFVGIEVEVERCGPRDDPNGVWLYKSDGSLRNGGIEFISVPIRGKAIPASLVWLFKNLGTGYQFSPRTSIHIHMDVRHLTIQQLTGIILTYLAVEPLLYSFVRPDRAQNIYCVPLFQTELVNNLVHWMNGDFKSAQLGNSRYAGLNLDAVRKFGTIEFRQLEGTDDKEKIITWLNLLFKIYEYGSKNQLGDIIRHICELNTNSYYIDFLNNVFGSMSLTFDLSEIKTMLEQGVKAVKQSILTNVLFQELKTKKSDTSKAAKFYQKMGLWGSRLNNVRKSKPDLAYYDFNAAVREEAPIRVQLNTRSF